MTCEDKCGRITLNSARSTTSFSSFPGRFGPSNTSVHVSSFLCHEWQCIGIIHTFSSDGCNCWHYDMVQQLLNIEAFCFLSTYGGGNSVYEQLTHSCSSINGAAMSHLHYLDNPPCLTNTNPSSKTFKKCRTLFCRTFVCGVKLFMQRFIWPSRRKQNEWYVAVMNDHRFTFAFVWLAGSNRRSNTTATTTIPSLEHGPRLVFIAFSIAIFLGSELHCCIGYSQNGHGCTKRGQQCNRGSRYVIWQLCDLDDSMSGWLE